MAYHNVRLMYKRYRRASDVGVNVGDVGDNATIQVEVTLQTNIFMYTKRK